MTTIFCPCCGTQVKLGAEFCNGCEKVVGLTSQQFAETVESLTPPQYTTPQSFIFGNWVKNVKQFGRIGLANSLAFVAFCLLAVGGFMACDKDSTLEPTTTEPVKIESLPNRDRLIKEHMQAAFESIESEQKIASELYRQLEDIENKRRDETSKLALQHLSERQKILEIQLESVNKNIATLTKAYEEIAYKRPEIVTLANKTRIAVIPTVTISTATHRKDNVWEGRLSDAVTNKEGAVVWTVETPVKGIITQSGPLFSKEDGSGVLAIALTDIGGTKIKGGNYVVTVNLDRYRRRGKIWGGAAGALIGGVATVFVGFSDFGSITLGGATAGYFLGGYVGSKIGEAIVDTHITFQDNISLAFEVPSQHAVIWK